MKDAVDEKTLERKRRQKTGEASFRTLDRMQGSYREASHSLAERKNINPL